MVTRDQLNGALGILKWSIEHLAAETGLSARGIVDFSNGKRMPHRSTLEKIRNTLEKSGMELIENGARRRQNFYQLYEGKDCYLKLLDEVYITLASTDGEVLFSGSDERRSLPEVIESYH